MVLLVVACALLDADGRILMSQRPAKSRHAGLWEFPGGKLEKGERPEQALKRELWEELGVEPCEECFQAFSFVSHQYEDFHLLMPLYLCRQWDGIPRPKEGQVIKWVFPDRLLELELVPADIPLAHEIRDRIPRGQRFAK
ncbi:MAG: 8-oxo-dGTP diphosphatase MutT [Robiginitomaculum sp.]|nr:MAG: 8-oxo-dGTP diphosphatase MutT [Robiginitomaculum sp.]